MCLFSPGTYSKLPVITLHMMIFWHFAKNFAQWCVNWSHHQLSRVCRKICWISWRALIERCLRWYFAAWVKKLRLWFASLHSDHKRSSFNSNVNVFFDWTLFSSFLMKSWLWSWKLSDWCRFRFLDTNCWMSKPFRIDDSSFMKTLIQNHKVEHQSDRAPFRNRTPTTFFALWSSKNTFQVENQHFFLQKSLFFNKNRRKHFFRHFPPSALFPSFETPRTVTSHLQSPTDKLFTDCRG